MTARRHPRCTLTLLLTLTAGCTLGPSEPETVALSFLAESLTLGSARSGTFELGNPGDLALGPVEILPGPVLTDGGAAVAGSSIRTEPSEVPTLNPGESRSIEVTVSLGGSLAPGIYRSVVEARAGSDASTDILVTFAVSPGDGSTVAAVEIVGGAPEARSGDVLALSARALDADGTVLQGVTIAWTVDPPTRGYVDGTGRFVGYGRGFASIVASAGAASDSLGVTVAPRGLAGSLDIARTGAVSDRFSSDLWLHGGAAYTGTWGARQTDGVTEFGNRLHVWDVSGAEPVRTASLPLDARTVNDVKVRADGALALVTHEGSGDLKNGVTILDLTDPLQPTIVTRFTTELSPGVHNVWVDGDYAYLVVDGVGSGLRILDISDPGRPEIVSSFYAGKSFLHDVYVRDGLAFLSHWDAGLVILDVGNGVAGGSPENPVEVSRLEDLGGETHNAWYWPETGYVFVGEEDFVTPGIMHVVDASDLPRPREVATYRVAGDTPHNSWLDEDRAVLYLAWYGRGLRALDVSGELMGELERQERLIASALDSGGTGRCTQTCVWGPQLHDGRVWVSDLLSGLVGLDPLF